MPAAEQLNVSKIRWRCRRGVKELDVVLGLWFEKHFASADTDDQHAFAELLELEDPLLFGMVTGSSEAGSPAQQRVLEQIRQLQGG